MTDQAREFEFVVYGVDHTGELVNCHTHGEDHLHALHKYLHFRQVDPSCLPMKPVTAIEEHYSNSIRWNLSVHRADGTIKYYEVK